MREVIVNTQPGQDADTLTVGVAQISPIWLDKTGTIKKVADCIKQAARAHCDLVVFGEALIPGYPFWVEQTDGARFNDPDQKAMYAHYLQEAVDIEAGDLLPITAVCQQFTIAAYVGIIEKASDRGGHSAYCTLVYIDKTGVIQSIHRKLQPTYEERLVWAQGDGHGLRAHSLGPFTVGGLNCYENWIPMARAALYGQGTNLHVSVWPGGLHNTQQIAAFISLESRSYVIACSGLMQSKDVPENIPFLDAMKQSATTFASGGSTIVAPDGSFLVEPIVNEEVLIVAKIDHSQVRRERQNFDPVGHYSRPDVLSLNIDRTRQSTIRIKD